MFTTILTYLLLAVEVMCCVLLVGVILLQRAKGQGVGLAFGAGMGESLFGAQVGNVLTRTTVVLAVIFLVNTTLLAVLGSGRRATSVADRLKPEPASAATMPSTQPSTIPVPEIPAGAPMGGGAPAMPAATAGPEETAPSAENVVVPVPAPAAEPAPAAPAP